MSAPTLLPPTYLGNGGIPLPDPGLSLVSADYPVTFHRAPGQGRSQRAIATIGLVRYYPDNGHVMVASYAGTEAEDHEELLDIGVETRERPPSPDEGWDEIVDARGRRALEIEYPTEWPMHRVLEVLDHA